MILAAKTIAGVAIAALALFLLDRFALWLERHDLLYYRYKKRTSSTIGNMLQALQVIYEPDKQYVIEEHQQEHARQQHAGDPLDDEEDEEEGDDENFDDKLGHLK